MPDKITISLSTMLKRVQGYAENDALRVGASYARPLSRRHSPTRDECRLRRAGRAVAARLLHHEWEIRL